MATVCTCLRTTNGQIIASDPECPAYLLHVLTDRPTPATRD